MAGQMNIGINGVAGRIGKRLLEELVALELPVTMINDAAGQDAIVHALTDYDPVTQRKPKLKVEEHGHSLKINGIKVEVTAETEISQVHWDRGNVKIVEECTGRAKTKEIAYGHIAENGRAGDLINKVEYVITSAPISGAPHYIMGVNHELFEPARDRVVSNASCTTKALALPIKVLIDYGFSLEGGEFFGVHAATNSQRSLEVLSNILIHSSGARKALAEVFPWMKGKSSKQGWAKDPIEESEETPMDGYVARVDAKDGSFVYLSLVLEHENEITTSGLREIFRKAHGK